MSLTEQVQGFFCLNSSETFRNWLSSRWSQSISPAPAGACFLQCLQDVWCLRALFVIGMVYLPHPDFSWCSKRNYIELQFTSLGVFKPSLRWDPLFDTGKKTKNGSHWNTSLKPNTSPPERKERSLPTPIFQWLFQSYGVDCSPLILRD